MTVSLGEKFLCMEIPSNDNAIIKIVEDEPHFRHALSQFYALAFNNSDGEKVINLIVLAAYAIVNRYVLLMALLKYMPDQKSIMLLTDLLEEMGKLVETTFGKDIEELQMLAKQREEYVIVIDDILMAHYKWTQYLRTLYLVFHKDAV